MYKIKLVFDSDGLIKLTKAGLPHEIFDSVNVYISEDVYNECVIEGKRGLYEESFEIESLIESKKIFKKKQKTNKRALKILKDHNFGKGEESIAHLFFNIKADAIVSDDKKFLNFLFNNRIPFMIPADFIINLHENKVLNKKDALKVLGELKPFIKDKYYIKTKNELEAKK